MEELYYLQDSRTFVGNDVMWWAKDGKGYTTDLRKAHVFTKEAAVRQHNDRETDIPWPKDYIDARTRPAVDHQHVDQDVALSGTGIKLRKPERPKRTPYPCFHCGRFMREEDQYGPCPHCGGDNMP
ncbi:hypothetical protein ABGV17_04310 [Guyparkeria sp. GHLCS8-2]|uniref:hypothetical protein n=1 Tax=Guyparkeria halopsychrophila TaxID=3139421 RepID=UPI0037C80AC2